MSYYVRAHTRKIEVSELPVTGEPPQLIKMP